MATRGTGTVADRFCEGALLDALESGYIQMLLKRLDEIANG